MPGTYIQSIELTNVFRSLFFLVSDTLQFVYDDFYEYASQFSFLTIEGAVSDITNDLLQHDVWSYFVSRTNYLDHRENAQGEGS